MTLTERLRSGTGADRELDRNIFDHFYPDRADPPIPRYTDDLNAVFALVAREAKDKFGFKPYISLQGPIFSWGDEGHYRASLSVSGTYSYGHDRCRALLLALLAAKEGK